jgi:hypothetical protein
VTDFVVTPATRGNGSVGDVDVSPDGLLPWLSTADGEHHHVWTLLRETGKILGKFGWSGRPVGQVHMVHNLAVDSKGNIDTTAVGTGTRRPEGRLRGMSCRRGVTACLSLTPDLSEPSHAVGDRGLRAERLNGLAF